MKDEFEKLDRDVIVSHLRTMRSSMGWQIIIYYWNAERERIINEGKKSRAEDKNKKMWAELDGFDKAATMAEKLERTVKAIQAVTGRDE